MIPAQEPSEDATLAQTLDAALSSGLLMGLAAPASAPVFDHAGAARCVLMAALAALGAAGAGRVVLAGSRGLPAQEPGWASLANGGVRLRLPAGAWVQPQSAADGGCTTEPS